MTGYTDQLITSEVYQAGSFADDEISSSHFRNCQFIQVLFGTQVDVIFEGCRFEACNLTESDLSGSNFINCTIEGCVFTRTRLDDCNFIECSIPSTNFIDCLLFGSTFRSTNLSHTSMMDCDAKFLTIEDCDLEGSSFEDTDLSDANLEFAWGLTEETIQHAIGNSRTILPIDLDPPDHWLDEPSASDDRSDAIPDQVSAPLRVIWRGDRLVPDPRGGAEGTLRNPGVMTILIALRRDLDSLILETPTNHPIMRHVFLLQQACSRGTVSINPTLLGYHIEVLKSQVPIVQHELSDATIGRIQAIITGGTILVNQFSEWRNISSNSDLTYSEVSKKNEIASAINNLAASIRKTPSLIDRRIAESLEIQAADISENPPNDKIQRGAARSAGNLLSALSSRLWNIAKAGAKTASEEATKTLIKEFIKSNEKQIASLVAWAPATLRWFKNAVETLIN